MITPAGLPDTIAELRAMIARGECTVEQALRRQRDALAASPLNSVAAMLDMPAVPARTLPLAGVGLAHKDIFHIDDRAPGCGTAAGATLDDAAAAVSGETAGAVARLRAAGAAPLAVLAMAEYACGATGENPQQPRIVNPIDAAAAVGGSSSGSAVAVAAGLCYGSLGTDTAGSVRMPAATCGTLGLKPSRDVFPRGGMAGLAPSLDTVGLLARRSADAALLFAILTGAVPDLAAPPGGWRVAACWTHPDRRLALSAEMAAALDGLRADIIAEGGRCEATDLPLLPEWTRLANIMMHAEAALTHARALAGSGPALNPLPRAVALPGAAMPAPWYAQACQRRSAHRARFLAQTLGQADVLLTPALPQGVPDWDDVHTQSASFQSRRLIELFSWMGFVNYLDLPAAVFPIAYGSNGRPLCVQAIAKPGGEATLLAFAATIENRRFDSRGFTLPADSSAATSRR